MSYKKNRIKKIKKIIIEEKNMDGSGDWRSFAIVTDSRGWEWELRGYGDTRESAEKEVIRRFNQLPRH